MADRGLAHEKFLPGNCKIAFGENSLKYNQQVQVEIWQISFAHTGNEYLSVVRLKEEEYQ